MSTIFLTGAAGFLGRTLGPALQADGHQVIGLVRASSLADDRIEQVSGDLTHPDSWRDAVSRASVIVHAAAVTGNVSPATYHRVNVDGTRTLLAVAAEHRVPFVLISSIAAGFTRDYRYFYAHSKRAAEQLVADTGLPFAVVRPTMIFGPAAPVAAGLARLATLPVIPIFGNGRVEVQPVHVTDLARIITELVREKRFDGPTVEVGGPERVSIESLLRQIRTAAGAGAGRAIHLPLWAVIPPLTGLELVMRRFLPVTVGQLASFANSGVARPDPLVEKHRAAMTSLETMINESLSPHS